MTGVHHGRLAVEQVYGYLFHNAVVYGIISTVNAFAFLRRERNGKLLLTQLFPATRTNPTILSMLYYFSHLCAITEPLAETHEDGRAITVGTAESNASLAPLAPLPGPARAPSSTQSSEHVQLSPRRSPRLNQERTTSFSTQLSLNIDIRAPGIHLGCKGYKGILNTGEIVFAKLWDGWKNTSKAMDQETAIYCSLRDLWGTTIPRLIAHGGWGFCHIILLEFIKVTYQTYIHLDFHITFFSTELILFHRVNLSLMWFLLLELRRMLKRLLRHCIVEMFVTAIYGLKILLSGPTRQSC